MTTFISYITIVALGIFTNISKIQNTTLSRIFLLFILSIYIVIVRKNGLQFDLVVYEKQMQETVWNAYFYREFVFHSVTRLVYSITNSATLSFIIIDIFCCFIVVHILKANQVSVSYLLIVFLSVGYLIGFFNTYRQHVATIIFALAVSSAKSGQHRRGDIFILLSLFTHNAMFYFLPLFVLNRFQGKKAKVLSLLTISAIVILILQGFDRGVVQDGQDSSQKFFVFILILGSTSIILSSLIKMDYWNVVIIIALSLIAFLYLPFSSSERLFISCITFLIFEYVFILSKINQKYAVLNLALFFISTSPFVFSGIYRNMLW